ncbi:ABC transporter substrate-binding protein [Herbiconiux sp. L3-i23]|uniref:ABC transporter substrate-binding protein n=1 Tax=Herbiconiux sp. L3-i23 TaxID=2905871 RepID=UPI0020588A26|nr:sugar ABC transporter substrate-binding protein [Herbiconiux sp. L3-i23]BDI23630.1 sugar ABC transporter substrate-binding protein [Herbiconiux sp. L3-i23]
MKYTRNRVVRAGLALSAAGILAVTAAGCASDNGGDEGPVTLNIVAANNPWLVSIKDHLSEFEEESGITVNIEEFGNEQLSDQTQVKLNAKSTDLDVLILRPLQELRLYADNGWLEDITDRVEDSGDWNWDDFQESPRETVTVDDSVWAVPLMTEREIVYYNEDLLAAKGLEIPTTLEELETAAAAINDPANGTYGVALRGALNAAVTSFSGFLYSYGADWQDEDGASGIGSDEAVEAYEYYGNLIRSYGPPGPTTMGWPEASAIFAQGKAGFYIDADSQAYVFQAPSSSQVVEQVGYAPFPEGPDGARPYNDVPWGAAVSSFSEHKDEAWEFIQWATTTASFDTAMIEQSSPSPRASSWENDEATSAFPAELIDIVDLYGEIGVGYDRPRNIQVGLARDIVGKPIVTSIEGGDVAAAAEAASAEYDEFLETDN